MTWSCQGSELRVCVRGLPRTLRPKLREGLLAESNCLQVHAACRTRWGVRSSLADPIPGSRTTVFLMLVYRRLAP